VKEKRGIPWHSIPERGTLLGLKMMMKLYTFLGPRLILVVLYPVISYFFLTGTIPRRASRDYLRRLFQQHKIDSKPSLKLQFAHFLNFSQALLDRLALYNGMGNRFDLSWEGREIIDSYLDQKQGVLLVGAHLGSFELLRLLANERDSEKVHALMYTKQAKLMLELFRQSSGGADFSVIPVETLDLEQMLEMRDIISRGEHIGILADRPAVTAQDRVEMVDFLGDPAPFPVGPWQLAAFLKAPVLLIFGIRTGIDRYKIFCEPFPLIKSFDGRVDLPATTKAYASRVEQFCVKYPLQWFNLYDFWQKRETE